MSDPLYKVCVWVNAETQEVLNTGECCGSPTEAVPLYFGSPACSQEEAKQQLNKFVERMKEEWTKIMSE